MCGAILGDIIGSPYEFDQGNKTKEFPPFSKLSTFTDDSVMTVAAAEATMDILHKAHSARSKMIASMEKYGRMFPRAGYGSMFRRWLQWDEPQPYGSYGNGSAMRVSSVAWLFEELDSVCAVARTSSSKAEIKTYIVENFGHDLSRRSVFSSVRFSPAPVPQWSAFPAL